MKLLIVNAHDACNLIEEASYYFAKQLMTPAVVSNLSIDVEFCVVRPEQKINGICIGRFNGGRRITHFLIALRESMSLEERLVTLAHEFVHVWQKATNNLQIIGNEEDTKVKLRWNGYEIRDHEKLEYSRRPWEQEAFYLQEHLFNSFIDFKEGRVINGIDRNVRLHVRKIFNKREFDRSQ